MRDPAELRLKLRAAGFSPLPLVGKRPIIDGWQTRIDVTDQEIAMWARTCPAATNTGILTKFVPTLDADILNEEAARAIEEYVHEHYDERGYVLPRIGLAPKRAIPFRTDDPFPKITANVIGPDRREEKIEFLGDGQQFVVDGIHPDTRQPYQWPKGDLIQFAREDLPYIHAAEARQLVDDVVRILEGFGYRLKTGPAPGNGPDGEPIGWIPNLIDHDELAAYAMKWLVAGLPDGAAVNFLREAVRSVKDVDEDRRQRRLDEIPGMVRTARRKLDREAEEKAEPAAKEPQGPPATIEAGAPRPALPPFCDEALALTFAERHAGELRYVARWGQWLSWTGTHWRPDSTLHAFDLARAIARERAVTCKQKKTAAQLASAKTVAAVERLAKADRRLAASDDQWDGQSRALNTGG